MVLELRQIFKDLLIVVIGGEVSLPDFIVEHFTEDLSALLLRKYSVRIHFEVGLVLKVLNNLRAALELGIGVVYDNAPHFLATLGLLFFILRIFWFFKNFLVLLGVGLLCLSLPVHLFQRRASDDVFTLVALVLALRKCFDFTQVVTGASLVFLVGVGGLRFEKLGLLVVVGLFLVDREVSIGG